MGQAVRPVGYRSTRTSLLLKLLEKWNISRYTLHSTDRGVLLEEGLSEEDAVCEQIDICSWWRSYLDSEKYISLWFQCKHVGDRTVPPNVQAAVGEVHTVQSKNPHERWTGLILWCGESIFHNMLWNRSCLGEALLSQVSQQLQRCLSERFPHTV